MRPELLDDQKADNAEDAVRHRRRTNIIGPELISPAAFRHVSAEVWSRQ
jgi:hypothetical protein